MAIPVDEIMAKLPAARRAKIEARAAELIREEKTLRELRRAARKTQTMIAKRLGVEQSHVSRLEQRSDMYLSTLRSYVKAMGGELELVVRLPDRPPVRLIGVGDLTPPAATRKRAAKEPEPA
jgi:hypothetical protein